MNHEAKFQISLHFTARQLFLIHYFHSSLSLTTQDSRTLCLFSRHHDFLFCFSISHRTQNSNNNNNNTGGGRQGWVVTVLSFFPCFHLSTGFIFTLIANFQVSRFVLEVRVHGNGSTNAADCSKITENTQEFSRLPFKRLLDW